MDALSPVATPILRSILKRAVSEVRGRIIGDAASNAFVKVALESLEGAIDTSIRSVGVDPESVDASARRELAAVLGRVLGVAEAPQQFNPFQIAPGTHAAAQETIVTEAIASPIADWATFHFEIGEHVHQLDPRKVLAEFFADLRPRMIRAAMAGSPLHGLVTVSLLDQIEHAIDVGPSSPINVGAPGALNDRRTFQQHRINYLAREHLGRGTVVDSTASQLWAQYARQESWRSRVQAALNAVAERVEAVGHPTPARRLTAFNPDGTYSDLLVRMKDLPLDVAEELLSLSRTDDTRRENRPLEDAIDRVRWLKRQRVQPTHALTLNLTGSFGSGRSRLITDIAQHEHNRGAHVLVLDANTVTDSFGDSVLRTASAMLGEDVTSVRRACSELTRGGTIPLTFAVDDVDILITRAPSLLAELRELIDLSSQFRGVSWVLASDELQLDVVWDRAGNDFWRQYGFDPQAVPASPTGWVDIDALNSVERLGLRILQDVTDAQRDDLKELLEDPAELATPSAAILTNPMAAWLRADSYGAAAEALHFVDEPNNIAFIDSYWRVLRKYFSSSSTSEDDLDQCVTLVAQEIAETLTAETQVSAVTHRGSIHSIDELACRTALAALQRGRVIRIRERSDLTVNPQRDQVIEPTLVTFWAYRVALVLTHTCGDSAGRRYFQGLKSWRENALNGDPLAEAVCEFCLILLNPTHGQRGVELWSTWAKDVTAPRTPMLLAAGQSGRRAEVLVSTELGRKSNFPRSRREFFVLMRVLGRSELSEWTAEKRLGTLRGRYEKIENAGLSGYLKLTLERSLFRNGAVSRRNYRQVLMTLSGTEQAHAAEYAADLAFEIGNQLYSNDLDTWITEVIEFMRACTPGPAIKARYPKPNRDARASQQSGVFTFVDHFGDRLASEMVRRLGLKAFDLMSDRGLCFTEHAHSVDRLTAERLRARINLSLGSAFQEKTGSTDVVDRYLAIIKTLSSGSRLPDVPRTDQRVMAFFLIRHSVITGKRLGVAVAPQLVDSLAELSTDAELNKRVKKWAAAMYEANNITHQARPNFE